MIPIQTLEVDGGVVDEWDSLGVGLVVHADSVLVAGVGEGLARQAFAFHFSNDSVGPRVRVSVQKE